MSSPTATAPRTGVGPLLREWRRRRRRSQLELALEAGVSARHVSFLETGRSNPSREMVIGLAANLELPLRDRNGLLIAAGYAPEYRELAYEDPDLEPVLAAIDQVLAALVQLLPGRPAQSGLFTPSTGGPGDEMIAGHEPG
ncbi:MAG TPA: helix-turn-helix transcriptional regulator [Solirubrobacterales bacterium]|nr:helix-turn-helix transcriptional regulator [Solirubrobacterales bacterium]